MENRRKKDTGFALLFGVAAGAALGWWLNSDNGRDWRRRTADNITDYSDQVAHKATEGMETARESVNRAFSKSKLYASNVSESLVDKARDYAETATNVMDQTGDALKEGAEKARKQLLKKEKELKKALKNHTS